MQSSYQPTNKRQNKRFNSSEDYLEYQQKTKRNKRKYETERNSKRNQEQ